MIFRRSARPLALCTVLLAFASAMADDKDAGFVPLFNGKDLAGWKVFGGNSDAWGAEPGILFTKGKGGGWLMTEKEYGDFELKLEYNLPKQGNSGVALRAPLHGNPAYEGMEIQLIDDHTFEARLQPWQYTGSIYGVVPPSKHVSKPAGEWNQMRIVAKGRKITIQLNGTVIVDADLDQHKDYVKDDPKTKRAGHPGLLREKGHLGLQAYNYRVDFRNIRVKPLN